MSSLVKIPVWVVAIMAYVYIFLATTSTANYLVPRRN